MIKCKLAWCDEKYHCKGYCRFHYNRKTKTTIPLHYKKWYHKSSDRKCKLSYCNEKHVANGYCHFHYKRKLRGIPLNQKKYYNRQLYFGCKVEDCNEKHRGKGYCIKHYSRYYQGMPLIKLCKDCKKNIEHYNNNQLFCNQCLEKIKKKRNEITNEFHKKNYVNIPTFGERRGKQSHVFTNGVTEEMKKHIPQIKNDVLNDAIKNISKYLKDDKKKK